MWTGAFRIHLSLLPGSELTHSLPPYFYLFLCFFLSVILSLTLPLSFPHYLPFSLLSSLPLPLPLCLRSYLSQSPYGTPSPPFPTPPRTPIPQAPWGSRPRQELEPRSVVRWGEVGPDTWCPRGGCGNPDKPRSPGPAPRPTPPSHLISSWHLPPLPFWKSHQRPMASPLWVPEKPPLGPAPQLIGPVSQATPTPHHTPVLIGPSHLQTTPSPSS